MARGKKLTCISMISIDGAPLVPFESLTEEQREYVAEKWSEAISRNLSDLYTTNPELFENM